ncbi:chalcone isomerase [Marchantia polymorpha subsp. ruderalis]|uniref:Chalcone-flavonone isomerase family protein n=2 Tax=Marchantia polymorpha TaxID=3197 RepID=A0AAF6BNR7_MARPO|nr:hypothetical protein MARPO_0167s0012 [Marchantia polymorpha]BBN13651.1 hypothetical protein Mp_6g05290 [Marchantia polymorpha subsp. ruderalis]|eukprot:PTQ28320.1 hypothetical protein MARPO_0167s0012 [Marchantia polymorpha]
MESTHSKVTSPAGQSQAAEFPKVENVSVSAEAEAQGKTLANGLHPKVENTEVSEVSEVTVVEGVQVTSTILVPGSDSELSLVGAGVRGVRLPHGVELKVTVLGIYTNLEVLNHLSKYDGLSAEELLKDDQFLLAFLEAPVDKLARVTMLLPLTGEDYAGKSGDTTEMSLKEVNKWGEAEELALKEYREFFKQKTCPPGSTIFFAVTKSGLEISQSFDSSIPKKAEYVVKNPVFGAGLVGTMLSVKGVSPHTRAKFGENMSTLLKNKIKDSSEVVANGAS